MNKTKVFSADLWNFCLLLDFGLPLDHLNNLAHLDHLDNFDHLGHLDNLDPLDHLDHIDHLVWSGLVCRTTFRMG